MSDPARDIVTAAMQMLGALDIAESAPSEAEMTVGLKVLTRMIEAWAADNLNVVSRTLTGTISSGVTTITNLTRTDQLAPGLNISGTGIASGARISTIDSRTQVTMTAAATASSDSASLTFVAIPFEAKFEQGVIALLAVKLAPFIGMQQIPPLVQAEADDGWTNLVANYMTIPDIGYDKDLLMTSIRRNTDIILGSG